MNRLKRLFHTCKPPLFGVVEPIQGREWVCLDCRTVWIFETREVDVLVAPAVWDRWDDIQKETFTKWWKKNKENEPPTKTPQ